MANLQIQNITTLEDQGKALAEEWETITKGDKRRFNKSTKADGFDTRLGKLMVELRAEVNGGKITSQRLREVHLHLVDKRRRSEAEWFINNEVDARKFVAKSKKGFTSLTALQRAMKPSKPKAEDTEGTNSEAEVKSNVGPTEKPTVTVTKELVFDKLVAVCKANNIDLLDIAEMLMEVDTVSEAEAEETKVAA
jgi:hypothetical protein